MSLNEAQRVYRERTAGHLAGELGFEPRQTESESVVLPLHHSPRVLNNIRDLTGILRVLASAQAKSRAKTPSVAPFYSFPPGLGKRAEMAWCEGWRQEPRQFPGARLASPVSGYPAHERVFRGAGFSPHRDGRAQPAAAEASWLRPRHLRDKTRRRVFDVEPVHGRRDRAGAARIGGAGARGYRRRRWRPRARLYRAGGARKFGSAIARRGRCAGRDHRVAPAGFAAARQATDG